jgi:hypothetical protein
VFTLVLVIWEVILGIRSFVLCELSSLDLRFGIFTVCFLLFSVHLCVMFGSWIGLVVPIPG